jgi:hypothetical protein
MKLVDHQLAPRFLFDAACIIVYCFSPCCPVGGAMDPIALATITSALTVVATEVAKGAAGEAGKSLWNEVKSMFGWVQEPNKSDLAPDIAAKLVVDPELAKKVVQLLQAHPQDAGTAAALVGRIQAEKVVVAQRIDVGQFNM